MVALKPILLFNALKIHFTHYFVIVNKQMTKKHETCDQVVFTVFSSPEQCFFVYLKFFK